MLTFWYSFASTWSSNTNYTYKYKTNKNKSYTWNQILVTLKVYCIWKLKNQLETNSWNFLAFSNTMYWTSTEVFFSVDSIFLPIG